MAHTLVTIPFSHFYEKVRWSLEAAGTAFREEGHVPGLHRRVVRRMGGKTSVPVLVLEDGSVLADSPLIVRFADSRATRDRKLWPADGSARDEALALERRLDLEFALRVYRDHRRG
jgi:glutathione S-transferase